MQILTEPVTPQPLMNTEFRGATDMQYFESRFQQDQWQVSSGSQGISGFLKAPG